MPLRNFILIAAAILISFACFNVAAKNRYANLFAEALDLAENEALYPQPDEALFISAMDGMLKKLDDYSVFIYGNKYNDMENDIRQEFGGVGLYLEVDLESKKAFVLAPVPGTPAFAAGIQVGDVVVQVNESVVTGMTREQITKLLRGPINETVKLTLLRDGETLEKTLVRAAINTPSVYGDYQTDVGVWKYVLRDYPNIGYIRLNIFGEKSAEELKQALEELPPDVKGLILDLRNNSGGLLESAVEICDYFLPPGEVIVGIRRRRGEMVQTYSKTQPAVGPEVPLVILMNRYSASASEVVAGCLQDHGRALIIGEQSFGKATVQNIIPMQRGLSALKLTTASYWRPSGKPIDRNNEAFRESKLWGIQPDPGFKVEIREKDILNVMRDRNIRDLEGLIGSKNGELLETVKRLRRQLFDSLRKELKERLKVEQQDEPGPESEDESDAGDSETEAAAERNGLYQDATLQRAIEHLNGLQTPKQATGR
jgi:carboxyl-terminal processing protease